MKLKSTVLAIAACTAMAAVVATPVLAQAVSGKVEAVGDGGRDVTVKGADGKSHKLNMSGSRTEVTIAGKKADRAAVKSGMDCTIDGPAGGEAKTVTCK